MCSPGACGPPGNWELTSQSLQAGGSALGGRLPPSRRPPVQNHCTCLANSKPEAMHTRTKGSTDKDNWGERSASLPGSPAPPLPSPVLLQPSPSSSLHWLFPHLDALGLQLTASPKFRPQLLWKPPVTPSSPPLGLPSWSPLVFQAKKTSDHKSTQYDPGGPMTGAQGKWEKRWERGWRQPGQGSSKKGSMEASRRGRGGSEGPRGGCYSHSGELCGQAKALGCRAEVWGVNTCAESLAQARCQLAEK